MTGERFWPVAMAVARRQLAMFTKTGHFVPPLLIPALFLAALAGGLSAVADSPAFDYPDYTSFVFVFCLLQSAGFSAVFSSVTFAEDLERGFTTRMMLAAPARMGIVAGIALAALIEAAFVGLLLFGIGAAVGMQISGNVLEIAAMFALALLLNLAVSMFGAGIVLRQQTIQAAPLMMLGLFAVLFIAPVYVPRDLLSGWLEIAADVNPLTPLMEAGRGLIIGEPESVALAFGCGAGLLLVFYVFALTGMRQVTK